MSLESNLEAVRNRIEAACQRSGRDPASVQLMAVSKGHAPSAVEELAALGQTLFGESKVQEAKAKIGLCPSRIHWQMIGHLQSNKCRDAVHFFEMIQSVGSLSLAEELQKQCEKTGKTLPILLEVNVAGESSKFGYAPEQMLGELQQLNHLKKLEIHGLMTIAPYTATPEKVRPVFKKLRDLKHRAEDLLGAPLPQLSMGMSGDFEIAIEEGSTLVRIGTLLFGTRSLSKNANPKVE